MRILFLISVLLITGSALGQDCADPCFAFAVPEGEPTAGPDYVDTQNGGCYSSTPVFQSIDWVNYPDPSHPYFGRAWLCGKMSWDLSLPVGDRWADTDWFVVRPAATGTMEITFESQHACWLWKIQPPNCGTTIQVQNSRLAECGDPTSLSFDVTAGVSVYFVIHPPDGQDAVQEFSYFLTVSNVEGDILPAERTSWGHAKSMYR